MTPTLLKTIIEQLGYLQERREDDAETNDHCLGKSYDLTQELIEQLESQLLKI